MLQKIFISIIFSLILVVIISYSCSDDSVDNLGCSISGSVVGEVLLKCGCCPGWLVKYGNDTLKFPTVPENDQLRDLVNYYNFPIPIRFNYKDDESYCSDFYKIMTCIKFETDTDCIYEGEIINYDYTECLCCPGWIIKVEHDTLKTPLLPIERQVRDRVESTGFPIPVSLDYENLDETVTCKDFYKKITCIKLND